jgi:fructosamine-3-kinase
VAERPGPPAPAASLATRLERLAGAAVIALGPIGGDHGVRHYRARLADGRELFVKAVAETPGSAGRLPAASLALAAEASGLRWLGEAEAVPIPGVFFGGNGLLALTWLPQGNADRHAAERFGRDLAKLHAAGSADFGAPWRGFIAGLPLPNEPGWPGGPGEAGEAGEAGSPGGPDEPGGSGPRGGVGGSGAYGERSALSGPVEVAGSWPCWYAERRLLPYARLARDAGTLGPADVALVEKVVARIAELAGPAEPPSRIHGDCWSGNVLWSGGRGWLIDPAAHGGHRETDLAMVALFGAPYLDRILAAYAEAAPLADGWRQRVPLHQLHPLLVHVCLFGAGYLGAALAAARAALAGRRLP